MRETSARRSVADLMTPNPVVVRADDPLTEAARLLVEHRISGLPVIDNAGILVGVVSNTDLLRARATERLWSNWTSLAVRHFMTQPAIHVTPSTSIDEAARLMERDRVHRLVVVAEDDRSQPIGLIAIADVIRSIAEDQQSMLRAASVGDGGGTGNEESGPR